MIDFSNKNPQRGFGRFVHYIRAKWPMISEKATNLKTYKEIFRKYKVDVVATVLAIMLLVGVMPVYAREFAVTVHAPTAEAPAEQPVETPTEPTEPPKTEAAENQQAEPEPEVLEKSVSEAAPIEEPVPEEPLPPEPVEEPLPPEQRPVLVLDAGHGGQDPGAVDATGTIYEANVAQGVLDRLLPLLQVHENNLQVITTHAPGTGASIQERAAVAKNNGASLFVSLHLNAALSPDARGFQVFPAPPGREHHEESMRAAQIMVENVAETGIPVRGTNGIFYAIYRDAVEKDFYDAAQVGGALPTQGSTFGVVEFAGCPALLVEQWFISNAEDMAMFNNEEGMQRMAHALYESICEYYGLQPVA